MRQHPDQCKVTRNGYECSRPVHRDKVHNFPMQAYAGAFAAAEKHVGIKITRDGPKVNEAAFAGHEHELERRRIMSLLLHAEFGGKRPVMSRPVTRPERWAEVLGEPISPWIKRKAARIWHENRAWR